MKKLFKTLLLVGVVLTNSTNLFAQQWGDYTLYAIQNQSTANLLDTNGTIVKTWTFASTAKTGYSTYMLPGGTLLRAVSRTGNSFSGGPICGQVQKVDWNGNVVWDFVYSTTNYCTHHDICPMPNGNVLLIAYERKTATEVSAAGCSQSIEMWPDKIVEVQPTGATTGTVVWEWHAWDHLVQNVDPSKPNYYASIVDHPELLNVNYNTQKDWMHMNGVDYNPILDQVIFSSHNLNEWFVIDHSTTTAEAASHAGGNAGKGGDFLYRWGHPVNYNATGSSILNVTHDAHWIPEGVPNAGRLVGFNNNGVSSSVSSVDQVDAPRVNYNYSHTVGTAYLPATYTSRLACTGHSSNMGNSQQLPNGNQLVCIATSGLIYEVNAAGTTIWSKQLTGSCPQAFRYDTCYANNVAPAIPTITSVGASGLTAPLADTYQWYLNGDILVGETNQTINCSQSGVYVVRITQAPSCSYSYSLGYHFTVTGISSSNNEIKDVSFYPNPANDLIKINGWSKLTGDFSITLFNLEGKSILKALNVQELNVGNVENGCYVVSLKTNDGNIINQRIVISK
ncbi:MAG: aryl-sulfate sulfotransferase [Bacteroidota bacterium]